MAVSYTNGFVNTKISLTNSDISEIEQQYNFTFPKEIADHYLSHNGGRPQRNIFKDSDGFEYIVNDFIPIKWKNVKGKGNLETALDSLRADNVLPDWLIPFADDPNGNVFCFSIKKDNNGAIYYWNHEYDFGEDPEDHITCLTESLQAFIESMIED